MLQSWSGFTEADSTVERLHSTSMTLESLQVRDHSQSKSDNAMTQCKTWPRIQDLIENDVCRDIVHLPRYGAVQELCRDIVLLSRYDAVRDSVRPFGNQTRWTRGRTSCTEVYGG